MNEATVSSMSARFLRSFIEANHVCSRCFERLAPGMFDNRVFITDLHHAVVREVAARKPKVLIEIGGNARPLLQSWDGFRYVGVDIDENAACHRAYDDFMNGSVEDPLPLRADIITSLTLLEHVRDNAAAARNMYASLTPGGTTIHYVASKWNPYSIALRCVGPTLQRRLIPILRPGAEAVSGYTAFFDFCTPQAMERLFKDTGFEKVETKAYYHGRHYFMFFFPAFLLVALFEYISRKAEWDLFCSGFLIRAARPEE